MKSSDVAPTPPRKIGRPLSFDRQEALEKAMLVFWQHGYETTSIVDLTTAMGVTAPSLYAAFGDKKRLFLEAARLYAGDPEAIATAIERAPTAYEAARDMLMTAAEAFTGDTTPPGCLLASATASGSSASVEVQRFIADIRSKIAIHLRTRIERDVAAGILPNDTDSAGRAGHVMAVIQGMSVLARDGATRGHLEAVVRSALDAWPRRKPAGATKARQRTELLR